MIEPKRAVEIMREAFAASTATSRRAFELGWNAALEAAAARLEEIAASREYGTGRASYECAAIHVRKLMEDGK